MGGSRGIATALVVAFAAALCAPAQAAGATVLVNTAGERLRGPYQRWVDSSHVPTVPGRVRVSLNGCPGRPRLLGCVWSRRLDRVYLRRGAPRMRTLLMHELGHLFDLRVMGRVDRRDFRRIAGLRGRGWFAGRSSPAERFAAAYSLCARHRRVARVARGTYGYAAGPARHAAVCRLIRRAAGPSAPPSRPKPPPVVPAPPRAPAAPPPAPQPAPDPPPRGGSLLDIIFGT